jgi:glycogen phosphorylase
LLYGQGYFQQQIDRHGNQIPSYPKVEAEYTPLVVAHDGRARKYAWTFRLQDRTVQVRSLASDVGRVPILLLDTDLAENSEADRTITAQLYGGDRAHRLLQEIVLGIGGVRALRATGLHPAVWHINEGHAAFIVFERLRELMLQRPSFRCGAGSGAAANTVFTTHTPVSAGHDIFPRRPVRQFPLYLSELGSANRNCSISAAWPETATNST